MRLLPARWPPPARRLLWSSLLLGSAGAAGLLALWLWSDHLLAALYGRWRPRIEAQVGRVMGHPLELGPYRGLGPAGLRLGPSRFLPGTADASTVSAREVTVALDPLASWQQRAWVLHLTFRGARAELRRNARGSLWVLGRLPPGAEPPRLALGFRLADPAAVRIWGLGAARGPLTLTASGGAAVRLHRREIDLQAAVGVPGQAGLARVKGEGQWQKRQWRAEVIPHRFPLAALGPLLPLSGTVGGQGEGLVTLTLERGVAACRGTLDLRAVSWRPSAGATPLTAERLPVRCRGGTLTLAEAPWRFGGWGGRVAGSAGRDLRVQLRLQARPPERHVLGAEPFHFDLAGRWAAGALQVERLDGRRGASTLRAGGRLGGRFTLAGNWFLDPADLPPAGRLPEWLRQRGLAGTFRADGRYGSPRLALDTGQESHPLLGPWSAALLWSDRLLRLSAFRSEHLDATATMPLALVGGKGLVWGDLDARLRIASYPLARLDPVLGTPLQGRLDAEGTVRGPLAALRPDLALTVHRPAAGPLRLEESWRGTLVAARAGAGGGELRLAALAPAPPGTIDARLDRGWLPVRLDLRRGDGRLALAGRPAGYRWSASGFPLTGLALALGAGRPFLPLEGSLSGSGGLRLQPLAFDGRVDLLRPQFLGVGGRRIAATVAYADRAYRLQGKVEPLAAGTIDVTARGRWRGPVEAEFRARGLDSVLFQQLAGVGGAWRGKAPPPSGRAADLAPALAIETLGRTLQEQLAALEAALAQVAAADARAAGASRAERLARLRVRVDADLRVAGPDLRRARADLVASGHLWKGYAGWDVPLTAEPFEVRLEGPVGLGEGTFHVSGLSLALLNLLTPVPESLQGRLAARGSYRLGRGRPEVTVDLALQGASLGGRGLSLEKGRAELRGGSVGVDLALRADGAANAVELAGTIPLDPDRSALELRMASRGDGLHFLTNLSRGAVDWQRGSVDLQLLVRGSLRSPIANGFLRLRDGQCRFVGQTLQDVQATVLFDFEQLLVQELTARVGARGRVQGEGKLGLVRRLTAQPTLAVALREVPFSVPRVTAVGNGTLTLGGSLAAPELGGEVAISRGSVNASPGQLATGEPGAGEPMAGRPVRPATFNELLEAKWDFRQPLVLLGPEVSSKTQESLEAAIPRVPWLQFQNLRLTLGPDLKVVLPNVAQFTTAGSLRISGRLDPSLRASGVVRLKGGRLTLFTTTFSLDPDAPNVAIFTPSLGLVPYLDIALRTRISDSLDVLGTQGFGSGATAGGGGGPSPNLATVQGQGGFSSLSQLRLILVTVSVSGPADRIAENLRLRSSPPLPQERLVALIGGNSLAGLSGGGAGTALATVVGQTLLSPLLATLSDALGQRVSLALYPTYVNPAVRDQGEVFSRQLPPQLVLGAEVGLNLSDRLNASVLAAPNRSDVAPQFSFTYQLSDTFNLQGSVDTQGAWQTQLQVFFRF